MMVVNSAIPNASPRSVSPCAGARSSAGGRPIGVGEEPCHLAGFNVRRKTAGAGRHVTFNGSAKLNLSAGTVDNDGQIDFKQHICLEWTGNLDGSGLTICHSDRFKLQVLGPARCFSLGMPLRLERRNQQAEAERMRGGS